MGCWKSLWAETVDRRTEASPSRSAVSGLASLKTTILREGTRFHEQHSLLMTEPFDLTLTMTPVRCAYILTPLLCWGQSSVLHSYF